MEYEDDNQSNRCYLKAEAIEEQRRLRYAA
jgi:hypothetical protein